MSYISKNVFFILYWALMRFIHHLKYFFRRLIFSRLLVGLRYTEEKEWLEAATQPCAMNPFKVDIMALMLQRLGPGTQEQVVSCYLLTDCNI